MANAADYLRLDTTQLLATYKLRTRSISARSFVATNTTPNYTLSVTITSTLDSVILTPAVFTLEPNASTTVTVEYDTVELELLSAGTLQGALNMSVSAVPIVIPEIPTSPAQPPLPEAPRQIISRIQITPSSFTFSEVGETNQYTAILYVGDVATPATFAFSLENNRADAFKIDSVTGVVKALKPSVNKALVSARVVTPTQYANTRGLANVSANIPVIVEVGAEQPPVTTGNLTVIIKGPSRSTGANVTISGINQTITKTTTFNNIPTGTYTVTPNVVTEGNENYNPSGGGEIYVGPGTNTETRIIYLKQAPPNNYSIQILRLLDERGNDIPAGRTLRTGKRFTVVAQTYQNGTPAGLGSIRFTANGTTEGVQEIQSNILGEATAVFTVAEPGTITVSAINSTAGSVTGTISSIRTSQYSIRITSPSSLITGQCSPVTAVVLQNGIETNIPVELELSGIAGRISSDPCGVTQPAPSGGDGRIIDTGINAGNSTVDGFGGATGGGQFNQIVSVDQGINAI